MNVCFLLCLLYSVDDFDDGVLDCFKIKFVLSLNGDIMWMVLKILISFCKFDVIYFFFDK